jgi:hypothetical protein
MKRTLILLCHYLLNVWHTQTCHSLHIANFRLSQWLIIHADSVLGLLQHVVVGDVADVSEVHAASTFRVKVCRLVSCCVCVCACMQTIQEQN